MLAQHSSTARPARCQPVEACPRHRPRTSLKRSHLLKLANLLLLTCLAFPTDAAAQLKETRRVLILNELGSDVDVIDQELFTALGKAPYHIEFYIEDLDASLFPDKASQRQLSDWFLFKYEDRKPDLIIAVGPSPVKLMAESHQAFAPNTPIVFWGETDESEGPPRLDSDFTGVWGVAQPDKTLDAALHLQPGTKHVVVVGGVAPYDRYLETIVKERFRKYESKLEFTYLTDLGMPELLERLKHLPNHTIVYHTSMMQDATGTHFIDATQSVPMEASAANAPVFVVDDTDVGKGTVGGTSPASLWQVESPRGWLSGFSTGKSRRISRLSEARTCTCSIGASCGVGGSGKAICPWAALYSTANQPFGRHIGDTSSLGFLCSWRRLW